MTSGSQNISPEVDFRKSKIITGNQKLSPEVDFRKSKNITGSRLSEVKKHHRKSTSESQKTLRKSTSVYKKNIYIFYFILFFKICIQNYKIFKFKKDYFKK